MACDDCVVSAPDRSRAGSPRIGQEKHDFGGFPATHPAGAGLAGRLRHVQVVLKVRDRRRRRCRAGEVLVGYRTLFAGGISDYHTLRARHLTGLPISIHA